MKSKYAKTTRQLLDEIRQNQLDETITAVKNKAKKTGMPYGILKKVYDRGMAAWKGGHRPGATQVQWALARVNSFVTKSSGTWGGADKDLAKKVRAAENFEFSVCEKCGGEECVCEEFEKENLSEAKYEVEATVEYRGVRYRDEVLVVVDASSESDADKKAEKRIRELRKQKKIGPGGGGDVYEIELGIVQRTNKKLGHYESGMPAEKELEEGKMSEIDRMSKDGKSAEEIAKALKLDVKAVKSVLGEKVDNPYAIGMAAAMKSTGDEPPLKKSTIKKAHDIADKIKDKEENINELTVSVDKVTKAKNIAKKMAGNMTGAVREIEKIMKGLSDVSFVKQALQRYNEDLDKDDEKQVKDVVKGLKKGSALHAKQAKELEKQIADEVELEESSWEKNKTTLPPHLKKLFDKDGNFINPKSQAVFDKMIKDNKVVVTDFWASWCNPCLMIAPHLEAISDEMKEIVVAKHNIDEEPNTPTKFGVRGIPTMLLFKDGELASTKVGATTKSNIQDWIKANI